MQYNAFFRCDLPMSITGVTPWLDLRKASAITIFAWTDAPVNVPVGALTLDTSADVLTIEREQLAGVAPLSSAAGGVVLVPVTGAVGTNWGNGFNGLTAKASYLIPAVTGGFYRVRYARTSGGVGDTLKLSIVGRGFGGA